VHFLCVRVGKNPSRDGAVAPGASFKTGSALWKESVHGLVKAICCVLHNGWVRMTPWQPMVYKWLS